MFNTIMNHLRDVRDVHRVSVVETALLSQGYSNHVLRLHKQIKAHVERHNTVSTEIITKSFVEQIKRGG